MTEGALRMAASRRRPLFHEHLDAGRAAGGVDDGQRGIAGAVGLPGGGARAVEPGQRLAVRQALSAPLMAELHAWLTAQLAKLSRHHDLAKAINYMLRRWHGFSLFLTDGRVCLTNNAAERALRCVPLGRKAWLFCGSDRGGQRAAIVYSLIQTCRLNDVDPQAWLADVLARIAEHPTSKLADLLPWNWQLGPACCQSLHFHACGTAVQDTTLSRVLPPSP